MRVEWVHPSWRDLVIESLAADGEARRHFLPRCGVDGVAIALSWGGGASGERERPLLRCDADWDALGDGLYSPLPRLRRGSRRSSCSGCSTRRASSTRCSRWRGSPLDRLGWAGKAISVDAIAAWVPLAAKLDPRPERPRWR